MNIYVDGCVGSSYSRMTSTSQDHDQPNHDVDLLTGVLKEREETISRLEKIRTQQEMSIIEVRDELHKMRIERREEKYWSKLDTENHVKMLQTSDLRVAELERELVSTSLGKATPKMPQNLDREHVARLHAHLTKSLKIIAVLDNQIGVVKSSCDEVVKSLKEELTEVMEERSKMELDLLNQISTVDNEKRLVEKDLNMKLQSRRDDVESLRRKVRALEEELRARSDGPNCVNGTAATNDADVKQRAGEKTEDAEKTQLSASEASLHQKIDTLTTEKLQLQIDMKGELQQAQSTIFDLENKSNEQSARIQKLEEENSALTSRKVFEEQDIVRNIATDKEEAVTSLERLETIETGMAESMKVLEKVMVTMKPLLQENEGHDDEDDDDDHDVSTCRMLVSTLDRALLLYEQVKLSHFLVELKLRNQMAAVGEDGKVYPEFAKRVLLRNRRTAAEQSRRRQMVQDNAIAKMQQMERESQRFLGQLREDDQSQKDTRVTRLRDDLRKSQESVRQLGTTVNLLQMGRRCSSTSLSDSLEPLNQDAPSSQVSAEVMNKLQNEIFSTVERLQEKNNTITELTSCVEEHKVREEVLKREVKRLKKKVRLAEGEDILAALEENTVGGSRRRLM